MFEERAARAGPDRTALNLDGLRYDPGAGTPSPPLHIIVLDS